MSIEGIVEKIRTDSIAECEELLSSAQKKADAVIADAERDAKKTLDETQTEMQAQKAEIVERRKATARLDCKKISLKARRKVLDGVYEEAEKRLNGKSDKELCSLYERLLVDFSEVGDVVSVKGSLITALEKLPVSKERKLVFTSENAPTSGGLYLRGKNVDKDLSFHALLEADREENEAKIALEMFSR